LFLKDKWKRVVCLKDKWKRAVFLKDKWKRVVCLKDKWKRVVFLKDKWKRVACLKDKWKRVVCLKDKWKRVVCLSLFIFNEPQNLIFFKISSDDVIRGFRVSIAIKVVFTYIGVHQENLTLIIQPWTNL